MKYGLVHCSAEKVWQRARRDFPSIMPLSAVHGDDWKILGYVFRAYGNISLGGTLFFDQLADTYPWGFQTGALQQGQSMNQLNK